MIGEDTESLLQGLACVAAALLAQHGRPKSDVIKYAQVSAKEEHEVVE